MLSTEKDAEEALRILEEIRTETIRVVTEERKKRKRKKDKLKEWKAFE